jgi:hypothetical protein
MISLLNSAVHRLFAQRGKLCRAALVAPAVMLGTAASAADLTSQVQALMKAVGPAAKNMDLDELSAAVADRYPGFAGFTKGFDGAPRAAFTAKAQMPDVAFSAQLRSMRTPQAALALSLGESVQIARAQFDARELLTYKNRAFATGRAGGKGTVFVDINEQTNRVEVGYDESMEPAQIEQLRAQLLQSGVASAALVMVPAPKRTSNVRIDAVPGPGVGGTQISFINENNGVGLCSVGVPVVREGVLGFVTGSHCSNTKYGVDPAKGPSPYYTPDGQLLASENFDPPAVDCSDFAGASDFSGYCRNADALFAAAANPGSVRLGRIWYANPATLDVAGQYRISGTRDFVGAGAQVTKTGRTTGTTTGIVARTCVTAFIDQGSVRPYTVLCATEAYMRSSPGDSGGAVFVGSADGGVDVVGILSYGSPERFIAGFSPWSQIVRDLGPLRVR